jgi:hypothetical protein
MYLYISLSAPMCATCLIHLILCDLLVFLVHFPKVGLCDLLLVCVSPLNFVMAQAVFMKLDMYIMAPEPISSACFINHSHQSLSVCVCVVGHAVA